MGWILGSVVLSSPGSAFALGEPAGSAGETISQSQPDATAGVHLAKRVSLEASWGTVAMEQMPAASAETFLQMTGSGIALYLTSRWWFKESLALRSRVGLMAPQAMVQSPRASALRTGAPAQMSLQYDFGPLLNSDEVRPWVALGPSLFFGVRNDQQFSAQVGLVPEAGIDFIVRRNFLIGISLGYQWVTGYQSAGLLSVGFGYLF